MVEKELVRDFNSQNVSRCVVRKGLQECKTLEDETLRHRRCDRNGSEGNEAIFDCTGGINVNLYTIQKTGFSNPVFFVKFYYFVKASAIDFL